MERAKADSFEADLQETHEVWALSPYQPMNNDSQKFRVMPKASADGKTDSMLFDMTDMKVRSGGNAELMAFVLSACIQDFPRHVENLLSEIRASPGDKAVHVAHNMKGAAGTASFGALAELTGQIEECLAGNDLEEAARLATQLPLLTSQSLVAGRRALASLGVQPGGEDAS